MSEYASVGARGWALVVDYVALLLLVLATIVVAGIIDGTAGGVFAVIAYICLLMYAPLTMMRPGAHNGQTFGKQALGIRVRHQHNARIGFGSALFREIVAKGLLGILFVPLVISYLWPLRDERRQALHDKMASTVVVRA